MTDIIDVLEDLGRSAYLRGSAGEMLESAFGQTDEATRELILRGNEFQAGTSLASAGFCCLLQPGKDDEDERDPADDPGEDEETPSRDAL